MPTIADVRAKLPQYADLSDDDLVDVVHGAYYRDLPRDDVAKALGVAPKPAAAPAQGGQFSSGLRRSFAEVPGLAAGAGAFVADAVGADDTRDQLLGYARRRMQTVAEDHAGDAQSFTDAWDGKTPWSDWLANSAGYVAGQALQSIGTAGLGALGLRMLAKTGAKQAAEQAAARALAAGASRDIAQEAAVKAAQAELAKAGIRGGVAGAAAQNLNMELGSIYPEAVDTAAAEGRQLDGGDLARVGLSGVAAAGVDTAMDALSASRLLRGSNRMGGLASRAAREIPAGALREGTTEAIQTGIEHYGAGKPIADAEGMRDIVDSAAVGAVGGGMAGAGASLHSRRMAEQPGAGPGLEVPATTVDGLQVPQQPPGAFGRAVQAGAEVGALQPAMPEGVDPETGEVAPPRPTPAPRPPRQTRQQPAAQPAPAPVQAERPTTMGPDDSQRAVFGSEQEARDYITEVRRQPRSAAISSEPIQLEDGTWTLAKPGEPGHSRTDAAGETVQPVDRTPDDIVTKSGKPFATAGAARAKAVQLGPDFQALPANGGGFVVRNKGAGNAQQLELDQGAAPPAAGVDPGTGDAGRAGADGGLAPGGGDRAAAAPAPRADAGADAAVPVAAAGGRGRDTALNSEQPAQPAEPAIDTVVDLHANLAATSDRNDRQQPTDGQKEAGNYKVGRLRLAGLDVSIENPQGSKRSGTSPDGKRWENTLTAHYGYVRGTLAGDGDHSDVFIRQGTPEDWTGTAYVIDQVDPKTGRFDEHKTVLGVDTEEEARALYLSNYEKGWNGLAAVTAMPVADFAAWVRDGTKDKPAGDISQWKQSGQAPKPAAKRGRTTKGASDGRQEEGRRRQEVLTAGAPDAERGGNTDAPAPAQAEPKPAPASKNAPAKNVGDVLEAMRGTRAGEDEAGRLPQQLRDKAVTYFNGLIADFQDEGQTLSKAAGESHLTGPLASLKPAYRLAMRLADAMHEYGLGQARIAQGQPPARDLGTAIKTLQDMLGKGVLTATDAPNQTQRVVNGKPRDPATKPSECLLLMPCGDTKRDGKWRADELYTGPMWQTYRTHKPADAPQLVILSAKHGFVAPSEELESYDERMSTSRADALIRDISKSAERILGALADGQNNVIRDVQIVGGLEYRRVMIAALRPLMANGVIAQDAAIREVTGEIGMQRQQLGQYLDAFKADTEPMQASTEAPVAESPTPSPTPAPPTLRTGPGGARYRDPATGQTWSGRGLMPRWVRAALDTGKKLEDFLIQLDGAPAPTPAPAPAQDADKFGIMMRAAAHDDERPGDVLLAGSRRYVDFDQAKKIARQAIEARELDPTKPFQFNRVLDIAPRDWDRMVKAMEGQQDELDAEMRSYERKAAAKEAASQPPVPVPQPAPKPAPAPEPAPAQPTTNTVFTDDAAARARELLRRRLGPGTLNSTGIDPEVLQAGITLAGWHIEKGARRFAAYAKAMVGDLGDVVRPYLKSWYMGVKYDPRAAAWEGLDDAATVERADVDALLAPPPDAGTKDERAKMLNDRIDAIRAQLDDLEAKQTAAEANNAWVYDKQIRELNAEMADYQAALQRMHAPEEAAPTPAPAAPTSGADGADGADGAAGTAGTDGTAKTDGEGNPIWTKGQRVVILRDAGAFKGRHGVVSDVTGFRWRTITFGQSDAQESAAIYSYTVKTDGGAELGAIRGNELELEQGDAPAALPDIKTDGGWKTPESILHSIEYARGSIRQAEGKLSRARTAASKKEHQDTIDRKTKERAELQAAYDAWAKEHGRTPAAEPAAAPAPAEGQAAQASTAGPGFTMVKSRHGKTGADLWLVKVQKRVERDEYDRIAAKVRANGGRWSKFTKAFEFPTEAGASDFMRAVGAAGGKPTDVPSAKSEQLADNEVMRHPYVYQRAEDGSWTWRVGVDGVNRNPLKADAVIIPSLEQALGERVKAQMQATEPAVTPTAAAPIVAPTLAPEQIDAAVSGIVTADVKAAAEEAHVDPADLTAAIGAQAVGNAPEVPLVDRVLAALAADPKTAMWLAAPNNDDDTASILLPMGAGYVAEFAEPYSGDEVREAFARFENRSIFGPDLVREMRLRTGVLAPTITKPQENPDDSAPTAGSPGVDRPVDAGLPARPPRSTEPVRGARVDRDGDGRPDAGGVRDSRGREDDRADESGPVGDGERAADVPDRSPDAVGPGGGRVSARDFRATPADLTREGSWFDTARRNLDLIDLARRIDDEQRPATPEEQAQLAKYVGFGAGAIRNAMFPVPQKWQRDAKPDALIYPEAVYDARWRALAERAAALPIEWQRTVLKATQYQHFTSGGIVAGIWSAVQRMGFTGGKMLEPGMGIGNFPMLMPDALRKGSRYTGIEFDAPTALIARLLSPQQIMLHDNFIKRELPDDFYDLAIGNPPFSQTKITADPRYAKHGFMIHDYFFAKSIDKVRPGGLLVYVTSKGTMDKQTDKARRYLSQRADLLGAIRLPSTAFEDNAGTSVVTDVIFLRKRMPDEGIRRKSDGTYSVLKAGDRQELTGDPVATGHDWSEIKTVDTPDGPVAINEYFAAHPDMVLGQNRISGNVDDKGRRINSNGYGGEKYTVVSYDETPAELEAKFAAAVERLPANVYSVLSQERKAVERETARMDFDPKVKREGVVYLGAKGDLLRVEQGVGKALDEVVQLSDKDKAWLTSYVKLRDLVQEARLAQVTDGNWKAALKRLNDAYDKFVADHGPLTKYRSQTRKSTDEDGNPVETEIRVFVNKRLYREDYDAAIVTQLETIDEEGRHQKSAFLRDRTIGKPVTRDIKTIGDALATSLDDLGRLDLDDIGERLGIGRTEAIEALGKQVYRTPAGQWQLADEYLSGNVVVKLAQAEAAAEQDPDLKRNVEALREVQPEKLGPSQISVRLGASWVDARFVNEFAKEIEAGAVTFDVKTESWQVDGGNKRSERKAAATYGTADRSPSELLEAVLNSRGIKVMTRIDKKEVVDDEATTAAVEAARKIKEKFKTWVWQDSERAAVLVEEYNRRFNNIAPRRFDGSHLTLPGVSLRYRLHPHQLRAIWRQIQTGNTYLAHAVGAGKTIEMIAGGMEQKRLGLIKKPMYVVPNHMLEQFANEFMELYPLANIMVADDQNFSKERRKAFVAAATLNAPDAVIITHDAYQRIGVKESSVAPIRDAILADLEDELSDVEDDSSQRVRRSQLQQQIEAVEQRFDSILAAGKKDGIVDFEDMGVDFVYVDEAHVHRKLDFHTAQQIKGIDPNGSRRALDMYVKTRWLESKRPGRSMVFASGTPVTNTMGELYTIMRFFAQDELDAGGIATFDAWARMFGETVASLEPNASGKYEVVERFARFVNVPELMSRVRAFMDVLQSDQLGAVVKRPDLRGGKPNLIVVEPTAALKIYQENVLQSRLAVSRAWKPSKEQPFNPDPVIAIISDGRFAATDPRFFGGKIGRGETTKMDRAADAILAEYKATGRNAYVDREGRKLAVKGGTQIVFYNVGFGASAAANRGFDARRAFTKRLTDGGIPRDEIAWFDDADTDAKKEAVFKGMRSGTYRVLIGSAKKMGTGVNVQNRLTMLHYMDPPWYPADVEQPHGRIIRQGNQNAEVGINWYATKGGYDATMWQMVGRKQRFIDQAFSGDKSLRTMDDLGEASQYEQAAALASGDPRALQLAGLKQDVERLERLQAAHTSEQIRIRGAIQWNESDMRSLQKQIRQLEAAQEAIGGGYFSFTEGTVGGKTYRKAGEFGQAVIDAFEAYTRETALEPSQESKQIGAIGKMPLTITQYWEPGKREGDPRTPTAYHYLDLTAAGYRMNVFGGDAMAGRDAAGVVTTMRAKINEVDTDLRRAQQKLTDLSAETAKLRKKNGAPFEQHEEMLDKHAQLRALEDELRQEGDAAAAEQARLAADKKAGKAPPAAEPPPAPPPEGSLFSRGPGQGAGVTMRDARAVVERIRAALPKAPPIYLHEKVSQAPKELAAAIRAIPDGERSVHAAFHDGAVYVFPANVDSIEELQRIVGHHEIRHYGMRSMLGPRLGPVMLAIYDGNPQVREAAEAKIAAGLADSRVEAVEEALADWPADTVADLKGVAKLLAMLREWLRGLAARLERAGLPALAGAVNPAGWSDADVARFVWRAEDISRTGARSYEAAGTAFADDQQAPPYYSALRREVLASQMKAGPAGSWLQWIKGLVAKGAVKADEVTWSGLEDWLRLQPGKITRDQVTEYLGANGVRVEEVTLGKVESGSVLDGKLEAWADRHTGETAALIQQGESWDEIRAAAVREGREDVVDLIDAKLTASEPRYAQYTLPGGTNYREVLLTLPVIPREVAPTPLTALPEGYEVIFDGQERHGQQWGIVPPGQMHARPWAGRHADPDSARAAALAKLNTERMQTWKDAAPKYRSGHWDQPNILAHIRLNDRTDADGKRVLFVEEIQSDWAQEGKKRGFNTKDTAEKVAQEVYGRPLAQLDAAERDGVQLELEARNEAGGMGGAAGSGGGTVPRGPFVGKTDAWVALAIKRIVKMAVDGGYDRVAFVTGAQSAERYDLSKQISRVRFADNGSGGAVPAEMSGPPSRGTLTAWDINGKEVISRFVSSPDKELPDLIGKDITEKLLAQRASNERTPGGSYARTKELSGVDLKVGGEGMRAFYDQIVPKVAKDVLRKVGGGQMGAVSIDQRQERSTNIDDGAGGVVKRTIKTGVVLQQPGFDITLAMREAAAGGLPLFSRRPSGGLGQALTTAGARVRDVQLPAGYLVGDFLNRSGKLSWWHKTVGTMFDLAQRSRPFRRVFDAGQQFLNDTSFYATEAANLAPTILPKLETWKDIAKSPLSAADTKAIARPIFEGTLVWTRDPEGRPARVEDLERGADAMQIEQQARVLLQAGAVTEGELRRWRATPLDIFNGAVRNRYRARFLAPGIVWTDSELRSQWGLTAKQVSLYREFRASVDRSLKDLAVSDMLRYGGDDVIAVREDALAAATVEEAAAVITEHLQEQAQEDLDRTELLLDTAAGIQAKVDKVAQLVARGYAPLQRFGRHTVYVTEQNGEQLYFGMFESPAEASRMARSMRAAYPDAVVQQGTMSEESHRLFAGMTPETVELFGEMLGLESGAGGEANAAFQTYLRLTKSNRSAMKRLIERKGVLGFNEDAGRVLASFVYSNARQTAGNLNMGELTDAVDKIPKRQGELKDAALRLADYVRNPQEEAAGLRGLLFAQYLGGSVASAMMNMTQPIAVTFPYLSQFGGAAAAAAQVTAAARDAAKRRTGDAQLDAALRRAEEEGIVAPQEVHQLMAQAMGQGVLKSGDGTRAGDAAARASNAWSKLSLAWGKVFSMAELANRRITFIAAYRTAVAQGMPNPARFAEQAINETQFVYNKGNRPQWARGAIGATLFTFKTYSISYLELIQRMWRAGPEGKKAAALAIGVLFLMAGLDGLPFEDDIEDVLDGLMQRLGFAWDTKRAKREALAGWLGEGGADFVLKGLSGLPGAPIDVSGRMGMGNLIPSTGLLTKKTDHARDVAEVFGPAGDLVRRAGQAVAEASAGNLGRAADQLMPTAARNVVKAWQMATTGQYRDERDRKVLDVDTMDAAFKALGWQPRDVARVQEATGMVQATIAQVKMRETELADQWARAIVDGDAEGVQAARKALADWNRDNPDAPIRIGQAQIAKRVRAARMSKEDRIAATAPKELRRSITQSLTPGNP